jgi:hypothetical protein
MKISGGMNRTGASRSLQLSVVSSKLRKESWNRLKFPVDVVGRKATARDVRIEERGGGVGRSGERRQSEDWPVQEEGHSEVGAESGASGKNPSWLPSKLGTSWVNLSCLKVNDKGRLLGEMG